MQNSESHTGSKIYKSKLVLMITICRNTQRKKKYRRHGHFAHI